MLLRVIWCLPLLWGIAAVATGQTPQESDYYTIQKFPIPEGIVLEGGGIAELPDGRVAVSTRRGDIYLVDNVFDEDPENVTFKRWAHGLHEVLGISWVKDGLVACQRCELTKIRDTDGDDVADSFETLNDGWEITGDYHEYAFGSKPDADGNVWVVLCLTGSFSSKCKYRGWCVRITPEGQLIPTCSGLRSPGGVGSNAAGDMFYTDNQGPWNGTCSLKWLRPGSFQGHPGGNGWYEATDAIGKRPQDPKSGSRLHVEADKIPEYEPPAILFPYKKMGQSASGVACDVSGKFGPFKGQMFVGDQTHSTVMRCSLEKVDGHYQGACYPFLSGFSSGSLAVEFAKDGSMLVGSTNRGWGSRGGKPFGLDRAVWTGKTPFEILEMKAEPDGFKLIFTQPVDPQTAGDVKSYDMQTYTYIFQSSYGSPEVDHTKPTITKAEVASDGRSVKLTVDGLQRGHVHELTAAGVRSQKNLPLLHNKAYYTLMWLPKP